MTKYILAYPPVDMTVPFPQLGPADISIYFHYDSTIGKPSCKALCEHCYFRSKPTFVVPGSKAVSITRALLQQGYDIGMAPADSFSDSALATGAEGSAFRLDTIGKSAWSSGATLAGTDAMQRLDRGWELGFRSIIITGHAVAGTPVPLKGVTRGPTIQRAIRNIQQWNARNTAVGKRYFISITFTIHALNNQLSMMQQMVRWGLDNQIDVVRFNCFANFQQQPHLAKLELTRSGIEQFFGQLATVQQQFLNTPVQLGISEDWGDAGIEQIYPWLPPVWHQRTATWCRAGYRLFAMIQVDGQVTVVGCVDKWDPPMGIVVPDSEQTWRIQWDVDRIEATRQAVLNKEVYACWGGVGCNRDESAQFQVQPAAEAKIFGK